MTTEQLDASLSVANTTTVNNGADKGFASLLSTLKNAPAPTKGKKAVIKATSTADITKKAPELTKGLKQPDGKFWPGTIHFADTAGKYGDAGAVYVVRFVEFTPNDAQFMLQEFGEANRDPIAATQKDYIEKQKEGRWKFAGNTIVLTVDEAGMIMPSSFEQHNGGHTCRAMLESGINALFVLIIGVPKSCRDFIDNNAVRTVKDIASSRPELKEQFAVGTTIGGAVTLDKAMSAKCKTILPEALRIVDDIRNGLPPKSGGSRDKEQAGQLLDQYGQILVSAIGYYVALDSRLPTTDSKGKPKAAGGLSKRIPANHGVAVIALYAGRKPDDEHDNYWFDHDAAEEMLSYLLTVGNEAATDQHDPMVRLRMVIDGWNASGRHDGSTGKNVRFAALKTAILAAGNGEEIRNKNWLQDVDAKIVTTPQLQIGGIDDYVVQVPSATGSEDDDDSASPLITEEDELIEEMASDVPAEETDE